MDVADTLLFALLALGDLALIVHLRRSRGRRLRTERINRSLQLAVRRETADRPIRSKNPVWALRRAS